MRLARQELRIAVATLLRRVRLEPVTGTLSLQASANTRPDDPARASAREPTPGQQNEPSDTS